MPDEIQNALTPEEWAEVRRAGGAIRYDTAFEALSSRSLHEQNRAAFYLMALANAALPDDDPRKITHADVRNVEDAIGTIMIGVRVESLSIQGLWDLAAKLAALLPPNK